MKKLMRYWFALFIAMCLIGSLFNFVQARFQMPNKDVSNAETREGTSKSGKASFTFMGVGDNLLHDVIFFDESQSLKDIDYNDIYTGIKRYTKADLNYINYETICAGTDGGLELAGYPSFNGPTGFNDAVSNAGFNWFSLCSNHTFDRGTQGVRSELAYLRKHEKNVTITGAFDRKKDADTPTVITIHGIRVGLASYCYGYEGGPDDPSDTWMVSKISEKKIKADMKKLNKVSDVQIVTMHWGTEYKTKENAYQRKYAKLLNRLGVEVIIGTHPHILEPVKYIHGDKQDTLCYYSLGNFLSAQNANDNMIGGMAEFKVTYDFDSKKAKVSEAKLTPTVTYYNSSYNNFNVYPIQDWTDKKASSHYVEVVAQQDLSRAYVQKFVKKVMGNPKGVEIVLE